MPLGRRRQRVFLGTDLNEVFARDFKNEEAAVLAVVVAVAMANLPADIRVEDVGCFNVNEVPEARAAEVQYVGRRLQLVWHRFFLIGTAKAWGNVSGGRHGAAVLYACRPPFVGWEYCRLELGR